jgi:hypothetical protein
LSGLLLGGVSLFVLRGRGPTLIPGFLLAVAGGFLGLFLLREPDLGEIGALQSALRDLAGAFVFIAAGKLVKRQASG